MRGPKRKVLLLTVFLLVATVIVLSACLPQSNINTGGFTVSVNLNGGTGVKAEDFVSGSMLVEPSAVPVKKGCDFLGWYFDAEFKTEAEFDVKIEKDIIIYAKWSEYKWEVTFVFGGEHDNAIVKVEDKGRVSLPEEIPVNNGYAITGWYKNSALTTQFNFLDLIEDDITIYAKWEIINYTISYIFDKGEPNINTVYSYTINNSVTLYAPTVADYEFLGWHDNEAMLGEPITTVIKGSYGNKIFYAKYLGLKNDIDRTTLGATINENQPEEGKGTIHINVNSACDNLTLDGSNIIVSDRASFAVFQDEEEIPNNIFDLSEMHAAEGGELFIEIEAKIIVTSEKGESKEYILYIRKYAEGASVTVTFDSGLATPIGAWEIPIASTIEEPTIGEVQGYTFDGWYQEDSFTNLFDFEASIGTDITIYAKFSAINYAINYILGVGNNPLENPLTYTVLDSVTFVDGEDTLIYNFDGWYSEKEFTNQITGVSSTTGEITVFAKYILKNDNSAIVVSYEGAQSFLEEDSFELKEYLEYIVFNKASQVSFTLTLGESVNYSEYLNAVWQDMEVPKSAISWNANLIGGSQVDMTFTYNDYPNTMASNEDAYTQLDYILHEDYTPVRAIDFDDFKINSIGNTVSVSTGEELVYAISQGYRPIPISQSKAAGLYNKAKIVLRAIIDDTMDDIAKLHKIYDWLILNVVYDDDLLQLAKTGGEETSIHRYNGFYLEGVFDDKRAVCDGISKAFLVLARIEGIETYQITYLPEGNDPGHAWNKVRLGNNYYVIDATSGGTIMEGDEALTHKYFMISDQKFKELTQKENVGDPDYFAGYEASDNLDKVAQTEYNIYEDITVTIGEYSYDLYVDSQQNLDSLLSAISFLAEQNSGISFTVDIFIAFEYGEDITDELTGGSVSYSYHFDKGYLILIFIAE